MKKILTILCMVLGVSVKADPGKLRIMVADAWSGEPVSGATVKWEGRQYATDTSGVLQLDELPATRVEITAVGYKAVLTNIPAGQYEVKIMLVPEAGQLNEVVVSGTLKPMQRMNSPIPVESYQSKFFLKNPTPGLFDAVSMINGVRSQVTCNVCNTGEIRINGLDGPYTMVLIDGMPIVSSLSTVYGLSGIPNSMVKRIEVVKGPASTLYGSEAVAGIINVITVDPLSAKRFAADLSGTTQGEWNADLSAAVKLKKANTLVGFNVYRFNNPLDVNNDNFTDLTLQTRYSLFNKWAFDRKNNLPASFAIRLLSENRWGGELQWTPAMKGGDSIYGESIDTRRIEWIGQYGITKNVIAEASYNYHWQDSYYGQTWYKGMQHTGFAQLRWSKQQGRHNWSAGIPFRYIHYDDNTPATMGTGGANKPSVQTMIAAFAQNEYSVSKKLTIMPGMRYEHTNLQGGVAAPRLALKWKPDSRQTFRLSGGNGFRIVNLFTEDHAAISGFREVVIAENLKPERSWNINANYVTQINAGKSLINIDASAFYTWFANRIIPDYDSDPQKIIYANLEGGAVSRGLSANIDWVAPNGIRATAGVTYMDVYVRQADENGKMVKTRQVYAPEWSGTYLLSVPVKKWSTTFDLTGTFTGPMRLPVFPNDFRPENSPWYTLLNLQATRRFGGHVEVYVSGKNLLNFLPRNPILHPDDPFDRPGGRYWLANGNPNPVTNPNGFTFDPTYNYAPMQGFRLMLGVRLHMH